MPVSSKLLPISKGNFTLNEEVLWRNILRENSEYSHSKPETWPFFSFWDVGAGCEEPMRFDVLPRYVVYDQSTIWQILTVFPRPPVSKEYHYRWPLNFHPNGTIKTEAIMTDAEVREFVEHLRQMQPTISRGAVRPILPPLEPRPELVPMIPQPAPDAEHALFSQTPMHDPTRPKALDTAKILINQELKFFGNSLKSLGDSRDLTSWVEEAEGRTDMELGAIEKAAIGLEKLSADLRECIARLRSTIAKSKMSSPY
ncbi:hypothetical protein BKA63DRAFT_561498 [Paraphoma chrysanthemicola]|nr:hypothetical protein BKA63DRAFT_561498 [Paraphoma chrysanthemicola]